MFACIWLLVFVCARVSSFACLLVRVLVCFGSFFWLCAYFLKQKMSFACVFACFFCCLCLRVCVFDCLFVCLFVVVFARLRSLIYWFVC